MRQPGSRVDPADTAAAGGRRACARPAVTEGVVAIGQLTGLVEVLACIRRHGAVTRSQVVSETGLSRAVVSQRAHELARGGLVEEGERGASSGGRAPRLLRFRAELGYLLIADLGATAMNLAITDLAGTILEFEREAIVIADGPDAVLAEVRRVFEQMRAGLESDDRTLWGIGIGIPGPVEFSVGRPVSPPIMPGWDEYPIRSHFADYNVPVWVDNDANLLALGEMAAGVAAGHQMVLFVKVGTGIGAGLLINGRLQRGSLGCAGDVGHIETDTQRKVVCRCGKIGCLESVAGGEAIARTATAAVLTGSSETTLAAVLEREGKLTAADVGWAATHGDPLSVEIIGQVGSLVGRTLASLVNLLNPSLIVIGGGVSLVGDLLLANIRQAIFGRSLPLATRSLEIERTSLGLHGGIVGAAALVTNQLFSMPLIAEWFAAGSPAGKPELARLGS